MRRKSGQWWDDPVYGAEGPRRIVQNLSVPLNLSQGDIQQVLALYHHVIVTEKQLTRGRPRYLLLMAVIFSYTRSKAFGRSPITAREFIEACWQAGYRISETDLFYYTNLLKKCAPTRGPLKVEEMLERHRHALRKRFALEDSTIDLAKNIISKSQQKVKQRNPGGLAAAALYLASQQRDQMLTQSEIAEYFRISEVTLRNIKKIIGDYL